MNEGTTSQGTIYIEYGRPSSRRTRWTNHVRVTGLVMSGLKIVPQRSRSSCFPKMSAPGQIKWTRNRNSLTSNQTEAPTLGLLCHLHLSLPVRRLLQALQPLRNQLRYPWTGAYHHLPGHLATQAAALPPLPKPPKRGRHPGHQIPVSAPTLTFAPVINPAIHSAPAPTPAVVPASQVAHNITPFAPLPHVASVPYYTSGSVPYYTPQPLVVYVPHPPYQMTQMTLYPIYPLHYPPPNI